MISSANRGSVASLVAVNTTLGAAAGAVSAMFTASIIEGRRTGIVSYDLTNAMNGCLTGLVAVTAPCATIETWAGLVIGIVAGWVYLFWSWLLIKLKIDDAVDAIPVHMGGGIWGILSVGLFTSRVRLEVAFPDMSTDNIGWFYEWGRGSGNLTLFGIQFIAVLFIFAWVFAIMGPFIYVLKFFNMLRVDPLEEQVGLDISRHKGPAYDMEGSAATQHIEALSRHRSSRKLDTSISVSGSFACKKARKGEASDANEDHADTSIGVVGAPA